MVMMVVPVTALGRQYLNTKMQDIQQLQSEYGYLTIDSFPTGAEIWVDNVDEGITPKTYHDLPLNTGPHSVVLKLSGYQDSTSPVTIYSGQTTPLFVNLIPLSSNPSNPSGLGGALQISTIPSGASAYVDNAYMGPTPLTVQALTTGPHTVVLKLSGYQDSTPTVTIYSQTTTPLFVNLIPLSSNPSNPSGLGGALQISSTPSGATIYIDGMSQGTTPATISGLSAGSHTVKLTKNGYVDYSTTSFVTGGQTTPLDVQLVQGQGGSTSTTGDLSITSQPTGASINIDGWDKGNTPQTLSNIKVGTHTLTLKLAGYTDWSSSIEVIGGQTNPVSVTLIQNQQGGGVGGYGSIAIQSNPSNANVYLDGQPSGTTPLTIPSVNPGTHTILLTLQGYNDTSRTVDVATGSQNQISVDLQSRSKVPGFEAILAVFSIIGLVLCRMLRRREE
jgi:hypothetical protein